MVNRLVSSFKTRVRSSLICWVQPKSDLNKRLSADPHQEEKLFDSNKGLSYQETSYDLIKTRADTKTRTTMIICYHSPVTVDVLPVSVSACLGLFVPLAESFVKQWADLN